MTKMKILLTSYFLGALFLNPLDSWAQQTPFEEEKPENQRSGRTPFLSPGLYEENLMSPRLYEENLKREYQHLSRKAYLEWQSESRRSGEEAYRQWQSKLRSLEHEFHSQIKRYDSEFNNTSDILNLTIAVYEVYFKNAPSSSRKSLENQEPKRREVILPLSHEEIKSLIDSKTNAGDRLLQLAAEKLSPAEQENIKDFILEEGPKKLVFFIKEEK